MSCYHTTLLLQGSLELVQEIDSAFHPPFRARQTKWHSILSPSQLSRVTCEYQVTGEGRSCRSEHLAHCHILPLLPIFSSSTHDALLVFECVRRGIMPKINRRLRDDERRLIRSGSVFIFDEKESGIKRWTDGLLWSPSRILWNFLVSATRVQARRG